MNAKTKEIIDDKEELTDDVSSKETVTDTDDDKLAALKAKMAAKQASEEVEVASEVAPEEATKTDGSPPKIVQEKKRSLRIGVVGTGQGGSRLASEMHSRGYPVVVMNTAPQDLEFIDVPEDCKLLLDNGIGGASRDLAMGAQAAEQHRDAINEIIYRKLNECQVIMVATSLGGGSGAGSIDTILDLLSGTGQAIVMMVVLPMDSDDALAQNNALQTLAKLTKAAQSNNVQNIFVADNARIQTIYSDVNMMDFFSISNAAIMDPIDVFNTLSSQPSAVKALDSMEWSKILIDGGGLSSYGHMKVANYEDDTAIAEAVIENLNNNLLSSGFDLKQSQYVGVMITAPKKVWDKVPAGSIDYAMSMINDLCGSPKGTFKGIYTTDTEEDCINVYSIFSGLGIPETRIESLRKDAAKLEAINQEKDEKRNLSLTIDTGVNDTKSKAMQIKDRIKSKNSALGRLTAGARDRRK